MNKKIAIYFGVGIIISIVAILIVKEISYRKTYVCSFETELIEGINEKDELTISTRKDLINKIELNQKITLNSFYDSYGSYYDSIEKLLRVTYENIDFDIKIDKKNYSVIADASTKSSGIVLKNLSIKHNGKDETTLRYDAKTNLNDKDALNTGDKINIKDIEAKGYKCK